MADYENRVARLEETLSSINKRLSQIESRLNIPQEKSKNTGPATQNIKLPVDAAVKPAGGRWLGGIAVLFFILAAAFFIKLAIDSGWLTPMRQFIGALLFGLVLIGIGFRLKEKDPSYSSFLPAAGVVVHYLAIYAGHLVLNLYSSNAALIFTAIETFLALGLFSFFQHDLFLAAATVGTYLIPTLMENGGGTPTFLMPYFLFWDAFFVAGALILRKRILIGFSAYLAIAMFHFSFLSLMHGSGQQETLAVIIFQFCQFVLFTSATGWFSAKMKSPLKSGEAWAFLPVLLIFYASELVLIYSKYEALAPWFSIFCCILVLGVYHLSKRFLPEKELASGPMIFFFISLALTHAIYIEWLPDDFNAWGALLAGVILILLKGQGVTFQRFWQTYFVVICLLASNYFTLFERHYPQGELHALILNILYAACLWAVFESAAKQRHGLTFAVLLASAAQLMMACNRLALLITNGSSADFLTSAFWGVSALGLTIVAQNRKEPVILRIALFNFGIVAFKVLFNDLSGANSIPRVFALIGIGVMLYLGGLLNRKSQAWQQKN